MKAGTSIPHNRVRLSDDASRKNPVGTDFAKQMSHELHTPLNVIIGLCQFLERDREAPLTNAQRDTVGRMERNARALLQSVNRLLECMRAGKYE